MTMVAPVLPSSRESQDISGSTVPLGLRPGFDLLGCIRALDGWVRPDGLAPRAVLDRLVEQGLLEAWPGRPLYRAPPQSASATIAAAGDAI